MWAACAGMLLHGTPPLNVSQSPVCSLIRSNVVQESDKELTADTGVTEKVFVLPSLAQTPITHG